MHKAEMEIKMIALVLRYRMLFIIAAILIMILAALFILQQKNSVKIPTKGFFVFGGSH